MTPEARVRESSAGLALVAAKALLYLRLDPRAEQVRVQLEDAIRETSKALEDKR